MKYELKSISIWSVIKISFFLNLLAGYIIGFLIVIFVVPFFSVLAAMAQFRELSNYINNLSVEYLLLFIPIFSSIFMASFNTLSMVIIISVYNLLARFIGGFEFNFENKSDNESFTPPVDPVELKNRSQLEEVDHTKDTPPPPPPPIINKNETDHSIPPPPPTIDSSNNNLKPKEDNDRLPE